MNQLFTISFYFLEEKVQEHHTIFVDIRSKEPFLLPTNQKSDFQERKRKKVYTSSSSVVTLFKEMRPRVMKCLVHSHTLLFF